MQLIKNILAKFLKSAQHLMNFLKRDLEKARRIEKQVSHLREEAFKKLQFPLKWL